MIKLLVDDRVVKTAKPKTVLQVCLENGIFIPNLCFIKARKYPHASCRLCFVEIQGIDRPVTSCTETVREGLVVKTDTEPVRRLQRTAFKLLLSAHHRDPKADKLPVYIAHGEKDQLFPVSFIRAVERNLSEWGHDVTYHEIPDFGHAYPSGENRTILDWFEARTSVSPAA